MNCFPFRSGRGFHFQGFSLDGYPAKPSTSSKFGLKSVRILENAISSLSKLLGYESGCPENLPQAVRSPAQRDAQEAEPDGNCSIGALLSQREQQLHKLQIEHAICVRRSEKLNKCL